MPYTTVCQTCNGIGGRGDWKCYTCKGTGIIPFQRVALTIYAAQHEHGWPPIPTYPDYHTPGTCKTCATPLTGRQRSFCGNPVCRTRYIHRLYTGVHWIHRFLVVRDGCACKGCGEVYEKPLVIGGPLYPVPGLLEKDHIVPLIDGGTEAPDNYQLLCCGCHRRKTIAENRRRTRKGQPDG